MSDEQPDPRGEEVTFEIRWPDGADAGELMCTTPDQASEQHRVPHLNVWLICRCDCGECGDEEVGCICPECSCRLDAGVTT